MTRDQLEHAIRAACEVVAEDEVIIFGSQAILGTIAEPPDDLTVSMEVDLMPASGDDDAIVAIDGALGELSAFHEHHGFYVQGIHIEAAILPDGWEERAIVVTNANTRGKRGRCIGLDDLAVSKMVANREKDRDFVRLLLHHRLLNPVSLIGLLALLPVGHAHHAPRIRQWVERTVTELT